MLEFSNTTITLILVKWCRIQEMVSQIHIFASLLTVMNSNAGSNSKAIISGNNKASVTTNSAEHPILEVYIPYGLNFKLMRILYFIARNNALQLQQFHNYPY